MNGANCVNIDMIKNNKDGSRMLLIEGTRICCLMLFTVCENIV